MPRVPDARQGLEEEAAAPRGEIELRHLRYFLAVARLLNFRQAAAEVGIAQPALSQQIAALERIVGARLFDRTSRSVALSRAGAIFVREAAQTLRQADRAQRIAERAGRGELGALVVAYAGSTLYTGLLSSTVYEFHRLHPDVSIEVNELGIEEQLEALQQGSVDIGILRLPLASEPEGVETLTVLSEPIVMAMRQDHPAAKRRSFNVRDLAHEPVVSSQSDKVGILRQVVTATVRLGFLPTVIPARHFGAIMSLVSAGVGIAPVPKSAELLKLPGVVFRPIAGLDESRVAIAYRKDVEEPTVRAFLETTSVTKRLLRSRRPSHD